MKNFTIIFGGLFVLFSIGGIYGQVKTGEVYYSLFTSLSVSIGTAFILIGEKFNQIDKELKSKKD